MFSFILINHWEKVIYCFDINRKNYNTKIEKRISEQYWAYFKIEEGGHIDCSYELNFSSTNGLTFLFLLSQN